MEQQVNLYQPMFLTEKHLFSARAIAASLGIAIVALLGVWGYAYARLSHLDRELAVLHREDANRTTLAARHAVAATPDGSLPSIEKRIHALDFELAARREALEVLRQGAPAGAEGYAERLQALGRAHVTGVWLQQITLSRGDGRLALQGAATDPAAIPVYVQALKAEHVLAGAEFDEINVERAPPAAPVSAVTPPASAPKGRSRPVVASAAVVFRLADGNLKLAEVRR